VANTFIFYGFWAHGPLNLISGRGPLDSHHLYAKNALFGPMTHTWIFQMYSPHLPVPKTFGTSGNWEFGSKYIGNWKIRARSNAIRIHQNWWTLRILDASKTPGYVKHVCLFFLVFLWIDCFWAKANDQLVRYRRYKAAKLFGDSDMCPMNGSLIEEQQIRNKNCCFVGTRWAPTCISYDQR